MWDKLRQAEWVKWAPNSDIVVALLTEVWMIAAYYTMTHTTSLVFTLLGFTLFTNLIANVLLPTCWVVGYRKQPLSELGITARHWLLSLILSLLLAGFTWRRLWPLLAGKDWVPHVLYCMIVLWEPFFVYSWLQLRFERAFGMVGPMEWHVAEAFSHAQKNEAAEKLSEEQFEEFSENTRLAVSKIKRSAVRYMRDKKKELVRQSINDMMKSCGACHSKFPEGTVPHVWKGMKE